MAMEPSMGSSRPFFFMRLLPRDMQAPTALRTIPTMITPAPSIRVTNTPGSIMPRVRAYCMVLVSVP